MSNKIIVFLIANFILALFFLFNFWLPKPEVAVKQVQVVVNPAPVVAKVDPAPVKVEVVETIVDSSTIKPDYGSVAAPVKEEKLLNNVKIEDKVDELACSVYGPVSEEIKKSVQPLFAENNLLEKATITTKPVYEIYWNVSRNKAKAEELFAVQKNGGSLSDDKFKLVFDDRSGNWIVSIAHITADENTAHKTTADIADKALKVKAGGRWQYRTKENVTFYTFTKFYLSDELRRTLTDTYAIPYAPC